jgi:hypothetical protein
MNKRLNVMIFILFGCTCFSPVRISTLTSVMVTPQIPYGFTSAVVGENLYRQTNNHRERIHKHDLSNLESTEINEIYNKNMATMYKQLSVTF